MIISNALVSKHKLTLESTYFSCSPSSPSSSSSPSSKSSYVRAEFDSGFREESVLLNHSLVPGVTKVEPFHVVVVFDGPNQEFHVDTTCSMLRAMVSDKNLYPCQLETFQNVHVLLEPPQVWETDPDWRMFTNAQQNKTSVAPSPRFIKFEEHIKQHAAPFEQLGFRRIATFTDTCSTSRIDNTADRCVSIGSTRLCAKIQDVLLKSAKLFIGQVPFKITMTPYYEGLLALFREEKRNAIKCFNFLVSRGISCEFDHHLNTLCVEMSMFNISYDMIQAEFPSMSVSTLFK